MFNKKGSHTHLLEWGQWQASIAGKLEVFIKEVNNLENVRSVDKTLCPHT